MKTTPSQSLIDEIDAATKIGVHLPMLPGSPLFEDGGRIFCRFDQQILRNANNTIEDSKMGGIICEFSWRGRTVAWALLIGNSPLQFGSAILLKDITGQIEIHN